MPAVQNYAKERIVEELKNKLGTEVGIGQLHFQPFNTIQLDSIYLYGQANEQILIANKLYADVDIFSLFNHKLVISSARLSDFSVSLSKDSANAPLNIQYIIDAFKSDNNDNGAKLQVKLNSVSIDNGSFHFDIKDRPAKGEGVFDVNHISVRDFNTRLSLKSLTSDSLNIQVRKLNLKEQSGFEIENLSCRLLTHDQKASLRGFRLQLPNSSLQLDKFEVDMTNKEDGKGILDYSTFDCIVDQSYISPKDISAFVPLLKNFNDVLTLKMHAHGSVDNLSVDELELGYGDKMQLVSNVEIKDLREADKMFILGSVDNLTIKTDGIESILNNLSSNKTVLPKQIQNLGTIVFQGDLSGYLNELTAFGSFETDIGILKTDILFGFNKKKGLDSYFKGKIYTNNLELGELLNNNDLDKTSFVVEVDMQKPTHQKLKGHVEGTISDLSYKGYKYEDITVSATYDGFRVDGHLNMNDPNGVVDIDGLFDLTDKNKPVLDFVARLDNIRLGDLNISDKLTNTNFSVSLNANFIGRNIDDADGYIRIDSLDIIREDKVFLLKHFNVEASGSAESRRLTINSDIINGEVNGRYSLTTLVKSIRHTIYPYFPALITDIDINNEKENDANFNFQIENTEKLSDILKLPVTVLSPSKIVGFYNNFSDKFKVEVFAPSLLAGGMNIKSSYVLLENPDNQLNSKINLLAVNKKGVSNDIAINMTGIDNTLNTNLVFINNSKQYAKGTFDISTVFSRSKPNSPLQIDIDLNPSELLLNNALWKVNKSHITIADGLYKVDDFLVNNINGNQEIRVNGEYSKLDSEKILKAELENINLEYIFQTLAIDVLKFGGEATGDIYASSIEGKPYANTNLEIKDFKFNGTELGNLKLHSQLDDKTNMVGMQGDITSRENKITTVSGYIDPLKQELSLNFDADSIDVGFLSHYASSVFNKIEGRGTGNVHLYGNFSDVTVEGEAYIQNGKVGIGFLNTDYTFTDTIYLKSNLIYFNDVEFTDSYNHSAICNGKVVHDFFHDFMYYIELTAKNFLLYNIPESTNSLFSGKVFATGKGSIGGDEQAVNIDVSMRTEDKTYVKLNFMEDVINEYSFITYKDNETTNSTTTLPQISPEIAAIKTESGMDINMNFYIDATPEAVVELVMDPVGGDVLKGSGSGAMQFTWSTKSAPRLYGTYLINRGSYNFTFQKLLERKFSIRDGSNVQFKGDPFDATLNVDAIYKITANLNDLDKNLVRTTGQSNIPVQCLLSLTGPLRLPTVKLDILFPNADPEVQRQIKSLMNTEDMINRQVTYLLLLSKFYTPDASRVEHKTSDFAAVASATLSTQLSKIVSQIDDRWQVGTNIRTSDGEFTSTEVELMLSSQLLNDRLLINGNFGYKDDPQTQDAFIGDVDIELLLNTSGTWRVKAYNHYNEKSYYMNGKTSQTQGVGLIYKKDFDTLKDLFNFDRWKKQKANQDTVKPLKTDTLQKDSAFSHFVKFKR